MINSLFELNKKVAELANYVVKTACEETYSGSYSIDLEEVCEICNIEQDDFDKFRIFFEDELNSREELLEVYISDGSIEISCALDYCKNYEWETGDEEIFGSYEEFQKRNVIPYSQPQEPSSLIRNSNISDQFKGDIILSSANMTVDELNKDQLTELKQAMYFANKDSVSWAEIANIDSLVSDEEVKEYYKDILFTYDDFSNSSNTSNLDNILESAEKRKSSNTKSSNDKDIKDRE